MRSRHELVGMEAELDTFGAFNLLSADCTTLVERLRPYYTNC